MSACQNMEWGGCLMGIMEGNGSLQGNHKWVTVSLAVPTGPSRRAESVSSDVEQTSLSSLSEDHLLLNEEASQVT